MKATLHLREQSPQIARGAFLRGYSPAEWLPQLQHWGIPLAQLECYPVPESLVSRRAVGLVVFFPAGKVPAGPVLLPCKLLGKKLLLPMEAALTPAATPAEWDAILRCHRHYWHPVIGLVGFEKEDRIDWGACFELGPETKGQWDLAHPGIPPVQRLLAARVAPSAVDAAMEDLTKDIGSEPLDENPDLQLSKDDSAFGRFKSGLAKGASKMVRGLMEQFPEGNGDGGPGYQAIARFANWLYRQTDQLQRRREDAIDRLLEMFDRNQDEALKRAIPMDNPFANRGKDGGPSGGGGLGMWDTNFNWGRIGGGQGGASWVLDAQRYQALRDRYRKAANDAVAARQFGKAAYIYAHLLHDFAAAANVLKQGKMYREAARLYKELLKDIPAAAACLEEGGLYLDAIDLYLQLGKQEKAADLYRILGLEAKAAALYEQCVDAATETNNHSEAARLLTDKLHRLDRALVMLLLGWIENKLPGPCLRRYLHLVNQPSVDMAHQVNALFEHHTTVEQWPLFFAILSDFQGLFREQSARDAAREIAYKILSTQAMAGNVGDLHALRAFLPGDRLIGADIGRYVSAFAHRPKTVRFDLHLNKTIDWYDNVTVGSQQLSLGLDRQFLWIARWNWEGQVEYYQWQDHIAPEEQVRLLKSSKGDELCLISALGTPLSPRSLARGPKFPKAVDIQCVTGLPTAPELASACFVDQETLVLLTVGQNGILCLQTCDMDGELVHAIDLLRQDGALLALPPVWAGEMFRLQGAFLVLYDQVVLRIEHQGITMVHELPGRGRKMVLQRDTETPKAAVITDEGCFLLETQHETFLQRPQVIERNGAATHLCFLSAETLVLGFEGSVGVYSFEPEMSWKVGSIAVEGTIAAIIAGDQPDHFGVLFKNGTINRYRAVFDANRKGRGAEGVFEVK